MYTTVGYLYPGSDKAFVPDTFLEPEDLLYSPMVHDNSISARHGA